MKQKANIPVKQNSRPISSSRARGLASPAKDIHFTIQKKENSKKSQTAPSTGVAFAIQKKENVKHVSNQLTSDSAPVQRYAMTPDGRLSRNGYLLLHSATELYATPEKIKEANHIGGQIAFLPGEKKQVGDQSLLKVRPIAKHDSELKRETNTFQSGGNEEREEANLRGHASDKVISVSKLEEEFRKFILEHREEAKRSPEHAEAIFGKGVDPTKASDLKSLKESMAQLAYAIIHTIGTHVPDMDQQLEKYILLQVRDRPLMPSDCRAMASYVSGFDAGSDGVETDEITAGNVYEYKTENPHAEWSFHYAAIIMTDGTDHVTMENAAAKASGRFSKKQYDRSWFFEMYGETEGQRFVDKYGPDMEKGKED